MQFKRYAIYYTAPPGPLADWGARWLGWDVATGCSRAHFDLPDLSVSSEDLTKDPRRYGFHATLKSPFRLAPDTTVDDLQSALMDFCASHRAASTDGLELSRLGRFLALTPVGDITAIRSLAATIVREFDIFRAAPTDAELTKRLSANLRPSQRSNVMAWGYPFVMDDFRFHITLTSRLPKAQIAAVQTALQAMLEPVLPTAFSIDALTLVGEDGDGNFHVISRNSLSC